jgi:hypothetical protein
MGSINGALSVGSPGRPATWAASDFWSYTQCDVTAAASATRLPTTAPVALSRGERLGALCAAAFAAAPAECSSSPPQTCRPKVYRRRHGDDEVISAAARGAPVAVQAGCAAPTRVTRRRGRGCRHVFGVGAWCNERALVEAEAGRHGCACGCMLWLLCCCLLWLASYSRGTG